MAPGVEAERRRSGGEQKWWGDWRHSIQGLGTGDSAAISAPVRGSEACAPL